MDLKPQPGHTNVKIPEKYNERFVFTSMNISSKGNNKIPGNNVLESTSKNIRTAL
jgi:hypothetical protein